MGKDEYIIEVYIIDNTHPLFSIFGFDIYKKVIKWVRAFHCKSNEIPKLFDKIETYWTGNLPKEYGIVHKLEYTNSDNVIKCYVKRFFSPKIVKQNVG